MIALSGHLFLADGRQLKTGIGHNDGSGKLYASGFRFGRRELAMPDWAGRKALALVALLLAAPGFLHLAPPIAARTHSLTVAWAIGGNLRG